MIQTSIIIPNTKKRPNAGQTTNPTPDDKLKVKRPREDDDNDDDEDDEYDPSELFKGLNEPKMASNLGGIRMLDLAPDVDSFDTIAAAPPRQQPIVHHLQQQQQQQQQQLYHGGDLLAEDAKEAWPGRKPAAAQPSTVDLSLNTTTSRLSTSPIIVSESHGVKPSSTVLVSVVPVSSLIASAPASSSSSSGAGNPAPKRLLI